MRYGIFSDVHSNLEALEAVLGAYKSEHIDSYFCVGDVVGYAADPALCIEKISALPCVTIAGNHDWASSGNLPLDYFNIHAKKAIEWTRKTLSAEQVLFLKDLQLVFKDTDLTLVHGTLNSPQEFLYMTGIHSSRESFRLLETQACFVGHTHIPLILIKDGEGNIRRERADRYVLKADERCVVNVGSVGQPRDDDPRACYCVYDTYSKELSIRRVGYDYDRARQKIIDCGLPRFLGDRLIIGK